VASQTEKPVVASFMGNLSMPKGWRILDRKGVPQFAQPERAVRALEAMYRFHVWKLAARDEAPEFKFDDDAIRTVLSEAASAGMRALGERHARRVIEACGLPLPASALAISESEAVQKAEGTGYPVVMKISSDDILHKSDAGGVRLGLRNKAQVKKAFNEIVANAVAYDPSARIDGVLVQQMVRGGTEVIVGMSRDPQFGPLIMFGLGGIYVELLKDVAFRVAPLTAGQAREMIDGIRASRILKGFRGQEPSDLDAVVDCILRVSQLAVSYPELSECDVNPLVVFPKGKGACAVDARFAIR
jgi:acetyltransferase